MKLTKEKLKHIILEELNQMITEQDGVDFQGMLASETDDEDLYQRMVLAADSGILNFEEEEIEKFLDGYRKSMDAMDSIGGLQNKDNWSDEQSTIAYNQSDDLNFYRNTSRSILKQAGLLKQ
tara:strand:+ start:154 stop:519 length:366 start_codon:yes stop_codon:yes gene_type:complete